jgi:hypothetical protein
VEGEIPSEIKRTSKKYIKSSVLIKEAVSKEETASFIMVQFFEIDFLFGC